MTQGTYRRIPHALVAVAVVTGSLTACSTGATTGAPAGGSTAVTTSLSTQTPASSATTVNPTTPPPPPAAQGTPYPVSKEAVAQELGGRPDEWFSVGTNGWAYRNNGSGALTFTVPPNGLVDTPTGRYGGGARISATEFTIYWT
jgi:hypothetical protein